jgi:serine protease Do
MRPILAFAFLAVWGLGIGTADESKYLDDLAIRRAIESQARALADAGQTIDNATLQKQVAERRTYDGPPPAAFELTQDGRDLYDTVDDGVLVIARLYLCGKCDKLHASHASGFVATKDGLAITNEHVMENADEKTQSFVAMTRDGKVHPIVEVLAANPNDDVALIRLAGEGFTPLPIAESSAVGQRVHVVSHPMGRFYEYGQGHIGRFHLSRRHNNARRVSVTSVYGGGSSGGPIVNDRGQVVAIVSEAKVVKDGKIVFYDSVPHESIRALFKPTEGTEPQTP